MSIPTIEHARHEFSYRGCHTSLSARWLEGWCHGPARLTSRLPATSLGHHCVLQTQATPAVCKAGPNKPMRAARVLEDIRQHEDGAAYDLDVPVFRLHLSHAFVGQVMDAAAVRIGDGIGSAGATALEALPRPQSGG